VRNFEFLVFNYGKGEILTAGNICAFKGKLCDIMIVPKVVVIPSENRCLFVLQIAERNDISGT
jgi:hypothetical protein